MRFIVVKRAGIVATMILAVALLVVGLPIFNNVSAAGLFLDKTVRKVPIYSVETNSNKVGISFDAAWGADKTEKIIEILQDRNVKATFFLVGFWAEEHPELVKKIDEAGFEIGLHSNSHPDFAKLTEEQVKSELMSNITILENILGKKPTLFRFPFGSYTDKAIKICEELGLTCIQWDVDSLDWKGLSALEISKRVLGKAKSGSICLFHNNSDHILDALPLVLDGLKNKGFTVTNIGDVLYKENFVIDRNGIQKAR